MKDLLKFTLQIYQQSVRDFDINATCGYYNLCESRKLLHEHLDDMLPNRIDHMHEIDLDVEYLEQKCNNDLNNENYLIIKNTFKIIQSEPTNF